MAQKQFPQWSIGAGFETGAFSHLSQNDRARLVRLMARISEQVYRRGAYQSARLAKSNEDLLPKDIYGWRYDLSLDNFPGLDDAMVEPAIKRLFAECAELPELGFTAPDAPADPDDAMGGR